MRKVLDKSTVAHYWANKVQTEGRTATNNFYFYNDTIYSYGGHFPIARHVDGAVLFTTRSYSNTTAKHISITRAACSHLSKIYCHNPRAASKYDHIDNLKAFNDEAKDICKGLANARKPEIYLRDIETLKARFMIYAEFFKIKYKESNYPFLFVSDKKTAYEATDKERKLLIKQEKERAKKEAKERAEGLIKEAKKIELWRCSEFTEIYLNLYYSQKTYLRFNTVTNEVETSKGVKIPLAVAARFYLWYLKTLNAGGCSGDCSEKILNYDVKQVNSEGLIVGCHDIPTAEIEYIKQFLKL